MGAAAPARTPPRRKPRRGFFISGWRAGVAPSGQARRWVSTVALAEAGESANGTPQLAQIKAGEPLAVLREADSRMGRLQMLRPRVTVAGAQERKPWGHAGRESRQARGYGAAWDAARKRVLVRDCGLCQPCKRQGRISEATAVDHVIPKFEGGTDDEQNLQGICGPCHQVKTAEESKRARGG